jgi:iron complex outermembrane receptor protein
MTNACIGVTVLAWCLGNVTAGWAQTVSGTISDETKAVLAGVTVTAAPTTGGALATTTSDATGSYRLTLDVDRPYEIRFRLPGFVEHHARVTTNAERDTALDVTLTVTSFAEEVRVAAVLDEAHTVGSRLGLPRQTTPASVDIVTQEVLQARGADTASTALRGVTGVTSSLRPGASAVFSTRGFIENSVGVLFNGVRVQSSTITMRNYDAFNFDRVEVLRGPGSVLHGEGVAAGAINFVRRQPAGGELRADGLLETGDEGRFRFGAAAAGGLGARSGYSVSFARNRFGTHVDDVLHLYNHLTGAVRTSVGRASVVVEGDLLMNDVDDPYWGTPLVNGRVDEALIGRNYNRSSNNRYEDTVGWGRVAVAAPLSRQFGYHGQVYVYRADRDWRNSYGFEFQPATATVLRRSVENLAYDHRLWGTRHELSADFRIAGRSARAVGGADFALTDFSSPRSYGPRVAVDALQPAVLDFDAPPRADDRRADLRQAAAFGEFRVDVAPRTIVVLGGRAGTLDNDIARPASGVAFEQSFAPRDGRAALVVSPRPNLSIYGQYATGSEPIEALLILGPAEQPFELAHSSLWEAGVKATLWGGCADFTAAVYRMAKSDLTTTDPEDSTRTIQIGEQSSRGVELSVVARPSDRWLLEANVAALDARYDLFFEGPTSRNGNLPPNVPEVVFNLGATWQPHPRVETGAWLMHVGERTADTTGTVHLPEYSLVDPFVRVVLGRAADVTLRLRNATNERYAEWATRAFGVTNVYFGEPRRTILSLRLRL